MKKFLKVFLIILLVLVIIGGLGGLTTVIVGTKVVAPEMKVKVNGEEVKNGSVLNFDNYDGVLTVDVSYFLEMFMDENAKGYNVNIIPNPKVKTDHYDFIFKSDKKYIFSDEPDFNNSFYVNKKKQSFELNGRAVDMLAILANNYPDLAEDTFILPRTNFKEKSYFALKISNHDNSQEFLFDLLINCNVKVRKVEIDKEGITLW